MIKMFKIFVAILLIASQVHAGTTLRRVKVMTSDDVLVTEGNPFPTSESALRLADSDNSTTVNLPADTGGSDHIFTGEWVSSLKYSTLVVSVLTDQDSATMGLSIEHSDNASNVIHRHKFSIDANTPNAAHNVTTMVGSYYRVVYENGIVATTSFSITTTPSKESAFGHTHPVDFPFDNNHAVNLQRSVITGFDQDGTPRNIRSTEAGAALTADFLVEVGRGNIPGYSVVHKFGAGVLTTTPSPVTISGAYQTPIANTALEFVSDSANDTAAGSGAQEITIEYIVDAGGGVWNRATQTLETNGVAAVALPVDVIRIDRWYVTRSGAYASPTAASHAGNLTIRVAGAGATWSTIPNTPIPVAQSQIGAATIPSGTTAYLFSKNVFIDTSKTADVYFFQRENANDVTTPFTGIRRLLEREIGIQGGFSVDFRAPKGPFVGPCDLGFIGVVSSGTADISVEYELLLIDD
ncbi:MAG: hypothetical protein KAJ10_03575 [Thermodesulfovibrionia bacterium]|nr:hypothetical protein [Thermodesulfovibrionia bacterium]